MSNVKQQNKTITLHGSAVMVKDFLHYSISNILYQRGVYPSEYFKQSQYYGLNLFTAQNSYLVEHITRTLKDIQNFLTEKEVESIYLIIKNSETMEYLEKWEFNINYEKVESRPNRRNPSYGNKDCQDIRNEISALLRQIFGATTILPLLNANKLTYEIQAVRAPGVPQWPGWCTVKGDQTIKNMEVLSFRPFSTSIHAVNSAVSYKNV